MALLPVQPFRRAVICQRWTIDFLKHEHRSGGSAFGKSYLDEIDDHLADASANATAMNFLLELLPAKMDVVEFFGGAGIQSVIIQEQLQPRQHVIMEQDDACIRQLEMMFEDKDKDIVIFKSDATRLIGRMVIGDLFVLDWNSWTISHWPKWKEAWGRLMERNPTGGVIWFDSSWSYFHMNRERYGKILKRKMTDRSSYSRALSNFFQKRFGYRITRAAYCPRGTYYLMQRIAGTAMQELKAYPNSRGFVWQEESLGVPSRS